MDRNLLLSELSFKAIRSSGAGGQHVNKVSSKIELTFDLDNSLAFTEDEKQLLFQKLSNKLTKDNILILQCDESRSQHRNKEIIIKRITSILEAALEVQKPRKATKPTKSSVKKRLNNKKSHSQKKLNRKKPEH